MRSAPALAAALLLIAVRAAEAADPASDDPVERGEYLYHAGGCGSCHTAEDGPPLGGGVALETEYGTFHAPNISPNETHGIGGWTGEQFVRAFREGVSPEGLPYYPSFPYPAYTGMTEADLLDLKAFLDAQPPVDHQPPPHALDWPYGWRFLMRGWNLLFLEEGPFEADPGLSEAEQRGAYLVNALGHCGQCHTPRNWAGATRDDDLYLAGTKDGPEGKVMPNITPDEETGIGTWSVEDTAFLLEVGMTPTGDFVGGLMGEVVDNTRRLTAADREAIGRYLRTVPPIEHAVTGDSGS